MHLATLDTRHYSFTALDATPERATAAVMAAWDLHCEQTPGADPNYATADDVTVTHMPIGVGLRDGERRPARQRQDLADAWVNDTLAVEEPTAAHDEELDGTCTDWCVATHPEHARRATSPRTCWPLYNAASNRCVARRGATPARGTADVALAASEPSTLAACLRHPARWNHAGRSAGSTTTTKESPTMTSRRPPPPASGASSPSSASYRSTPTAAMKGRTTLPAIETHRAAYSPSTRRHRVTTSSTSPAASTSARQGPLRAGRHHHHLGVRQRADPGRRPDHLVTAPRQDDVGQHRREPEQGEPLSAPAALHRGLRPAGRDPRDGDGRSLIHPRPAALETPPVRDRSRERNPDPAEAPRDHHRTKEHPMSNALTTPRCVCARNQDGSVTTSLCPLHADTDPCLTKSLITGKRRAGTIRRGVCTSCGHGRAAA